MNAARPAAIATVLTLPLWLLLSGTAAASTRDRDHDRMPDRWEIKYKLDPRSAKDAKLDPDKDGLVNLAEYRDKTNPRKADSDGDRMPDGWEVRYGFNPRSDLTAGFVPWNHDPNGTRDSDRDALVNISEYRLKTNPRNPDTDGDGRLDGQEARDGTNPLVKDAPAGTPTTIEVPVDRPIQLPAPAPIRDSDGDGLNDAVEAVLGTDPNAADSDNDGLQDGAELTAGTDPKDPDTDDDGLTDGAETTATPPTDPVKADTDNDRLNDGAERAAGTDPTKPDTDADGLYDGAETPSITPTRWWRTGRR